MSDNRKYYYLKLKENYFDDDSIVLLESMQDGVLYSNILLKLYLKSLKHGGRLQLDEDIPYTAQMIATITRQQIGTVERALQIFLKLGLVEVLDSGTFYMPIHSRPPDKTSGYFLPIDPTGTPENQPSPWFSAFCKRISGVCRVTFSKQRRFFYGIL